MSFLRLPSLFRRFTSSRYFEDSLSPELAKLRKPGFYVRNPIEFIPNNAYILGGALVYFTVTLYWLKVVSSEWKYDCGVFLSGECSGGKNRALLHQIEFATYVNAFNARRKYEDGGVDGEGRFLMEAVQNKLEAEEEKTTTTPTYH